MSQNEKKINLQNRYNGFKGLLTQKRDNVSRFKTTLESVPIETQNLELQIKHDSKECELKEILIEKKKAEIARTQLNNKLLELTIRDNKRGIDILERNIKAEEKNIRAIEKQIKDIKSQARNEGMKLEK